MKILGCDQSFTSTGMVVVNEDGEIEFAERYVSDNNDDMFSRAWEIATAIAEIGREYSPTVVCLEGLAFGATGNQTRNLGGLQFVIYCVLKFTEGFKVDIVSPRSVKKFATGSGNASKEDMIESLPEHVREYFDRMGVKKTTGLSDLTDAYFFATYYIAEHEK